MRHKGDPSTKPAQIYISVYPIPRSTASPQSASAQEIIAKACITGTMSYLYI